MSDLVLKMHMKIKLNINKCNAYFNRLFLYFYVIYLFLLIDTCAILDRNKHMPF